MQLTGKNILIICIGFIIVGLFLILAWKSNENIYVIGWIAVFTGGVIGALGLANAVFDKPNLIPQNFSNLKTEGIDIQINRFIALFVWLIPGGSMIWITIMEIEKHGFTSGFFWLFFADLFLAYVSLGWLFMNYKLYPDRIKVRSIFKLPFTKEIFFRELIDVKALTKSEEANRLSQTRTLGKGKIGKDVALLMFGFVKQGNYGSVILRTKTEKIELHHVRYPANLVEVIQKLRKS